MIGILLVVSSLLLLILLSIIILAVHLIQWIKRRDTANEKVYNQLRTEINDTQSLFRKEVTAILNQFKNILK